MERDVGLEEPRYITRAARRFHLLDEGFESATERGGQVLHRPANRAAFQIRAQCVDLFHVGSRERHDERTAPGATDEQTFLLELAKCFTDRRTTDLHLPRDLRFVDALTRLQNVGHDRAADCVVDL